MAGHMLCFVIAVIPAVGLACGRGGRPVPQPTTKETAGSGSQRETTYLAPHIRYVPEPCRSTSAVLCFSDTAFTPRIRYSDEPYWNARANWIWFGAAGDSLDISADDGVLTTSLGQEYDSRRNNTSYFRHRLTRDGLVSISIDMEESQGDRIGYTLRIRRVAPVLRNGLRPTGDRARLTVESAGRTDQFSLIPLSISPTVRDRSHWKAFAFERTYNVALVDDSLYEFCRVPCSRPDTLKLTPSHSVRHRY